jgi:oligoribonuclease
MDQHSPQQHGEPLTNDPIIWVDCEMTGLDLAKDATVEIAVIVTDSALQPLGEGVDVLIRPPEQALAQMVPTVRHMHEASGLLAALEGGLDLAQAQAQVMQYVTQWAPQPGRCPLAGNSVSTDRAFLERDFPALAQHLHYRTIDVSSIKELARRWYPRIYFRAPSKAGNHRALADIIESIDELRYYRSVFFVPEPGPSSEEAIAAAETVVRTSARHTFTPHF